MERTCTNGKEKLWLCHNWLPDPTQPNSCDAASYESKITTGIIRISEAILVGLDTGRLPFSLQGGTQVPAVPRDPTSPKSRLKAGLRGLTHHRFVLPVSAKLPGLTARGFTGCLSPRELQKEQKCCSSVQLEAWQPRSARVFQQHGGTRGCLEAERMLPRARSQETCLTCTWNFTDTPE